MLVVMPVEGRHRETIGQICQLCRTELPLDLPVRRKPQGDEGMPTAFCMSHTLLRVYAVHVPHKNARLFCM